MSRPLRILLVEDNPGDADLTMETLQDGGPPVEIAIAIDGADALARLLRQPPHANADRPDLVLLDLNLPKVGGHEVLAQIRQQPALRTLPVIVLTSSDAERDVVDSYELGANCYVVKPVGLEAFQATVRAISEFWFRVVKIS